MRQTKDFFVKNNRLNKGNQVSDNQTLEKNIRSALPRPDMLAEYEAANPGSAQKLIEMASKEQEHEHKMEELKLTMQARGARMGRVCGLFVVLAICFFTATISSAGHIVYGLIFAFLSFGAMIMLGCKQCKNQNTGFVPRNDRGNYKGNNPRFQHHQKNEAKATEGETSAPEQENRPRNNNRNYHNRYKRKNQ